MPSIEELTDDLKIVSEYRNLVYIKPWLALPLWGALISMGEIWHWKLGFVLAFILLVGGTLVSARWILLKWCVFRAGSQYAIHSTNGRSHLQLFVRMDRVVVTYDANKPENSI